MVHGSHGSPNSGDGQFHDVVSLTVNAIAHPASSQRWRVRTASEYRAASVANTASVTRVVGRVSAKVANGRWRRSAREKAASSPAASRSGSAQWTCTQTSSSEAAITAMSSAGPGRRREVVTRSPPPAAA